MLMILLVVLSVEKGIGILHFYQSVWQEQFLDF